MNLYTEQTWELVGATEQDIAYLERLGVSITVERPYREVTTYGQTHRYYAGHFSVTIITTCEKIGLMLQLKYSSNLILLETSHTVY